jgi:hypothetical protein
MPLQGRNEERWFQLCGQAAVEQDPVKMLALVTEINDLLEAKEARLVQQRKDGAEAPALPKDKRGGTD